MKITIFSLINLIAIGCSDHPVSVPRVPQLPDVPISRLEGYPDTITAEGRQLYLSTYMWRDFQPISPPDGKPLIALIYITATDTAPLPESISSDAVWIVYNNQVWKSWSEPIAPDERKPNRIAKIARDGPKWGPHVRADVIVRVYDGVCNAHMLRAANQWISETD